MAPRANWKGFLQVAELTCPVALYTAASTSDRIAFHTLNRATGHRVRRQFVDQETGHPVEAGLQRYVGSIEDPDQIYSNKVLSELRRLQSIFSPRSQSAGASS